MNLDKMLENISIDIQFPTSWKDNFKGGIIEHVELVKNKPNNLKDKLSKYSELANSLIFLLIAFQEKTPSCYVLLELF